MVSNIFSSSDSGKIAPLGINKRESLSISDSEDFDQMVVKMFERLENSTESAKEVVEQYAKNPEGVSLERMALLMSKAETEIRVATQVRNRMVSAYQDVMNMQV